jgi:signal transduction histidine kinase
VDGLRQLMNSVERAGDVKIELHTEPSIPMIPEQVEDEMIRIAQEALQNALRYGNGTQITISLEAMVGDGINLRISDDGRGFNTNTITPGYGLIGMRERAEGIGAAMTIISEPGYGTQIIVSWLPPHNRQENSDARSK